MSNKVTLRERIAFFGGGLGETMIFITISSFLMFFYTEVMGISPMVVGTLFLVARIWDAVNDPLMGTMADRTKARMGSFRPYIAYGAIPLSLFTVLCFTNPQLSMTGKIVWAYVTYIGMGMLYTLVDLPFLSLMSVATQNQDERNSLSAARSWGAQLGLLISTGSMMALVGLFGKGDQAKGYQLAMLLFASFSAVLFIFLAVSSKERAPVPPKQNMGVKEGLKLLSTNNPWIVLNIFFVVFFLYMIIRYAFSMYYVTFYLKNQQVFGPYMIMSTIPSFFVIPFVPYLSRKFGKKMTLSIGALTILVSGLVYFIAKTSIPLVFVAAAINGLGMGVLHPTMWAMLPDTVEYGEWKTGKRAPGLTVSAASFAQKAAQGLAGWLAGLILTVIAFQQGVPVQTEQTISGLYTWNALIPVLFGILTVIVMKFYSLDEKTFSGIMEDLGKREAVKSDTLVEARA